jgi:[amino group carrier protein]-L-2-aminoadipate 6-kinase
MTSAPASGRPLVVKLGGGDTIDVERCLDDLAELWRHGRSIVLVHGGGADADRLSEQLGITPRHVTSASGVRSRLTDEAALDVLTMALVGRVKPRLVTGLNARGVAAVGLTGIDGPSVHLQRKAALRVQESGRVRVVHDDRSGRIVRVEPRLWRLLIDAGIVPVISPPGFGDEGPLNVDADRMAASVAAALGAEVLLFLSDVPGILRDLDNPSSVVGRLDRRDLAVSGFARGRMRHKTLAAGEALDGGVRRVIIANGTKVGAVRAALQGDGTVIEAGVGPEPSIAGPLS